MDDKHVILTPSEIAHEALRILRDVLEIPPYVNWNCVHDGILYGREYGYGEEWCCADRLEGPDRLFNGHPVIHLERLGLDMELAHTVHVEVLLAKNEVTQTLQVFSEETIAPAMRAIANYLYERCAELHGDGDREHKDVVFVCAPLPVPDKLAILGETVGEEDSKISVRVMYSYETMYMSQTIHFDVLCGFAKLTTKEEKE